MAIVFVYLKKAKKSFLDEVKIEKTVAKKQKKEFMLSHPNKILYPEAQITKEDLLHYSEEARAHILPFISLRPLTLVRYPSDYGHSFY